MNAYLRKGDFWSGLILAGLGAYIVQQASGWAYITAEGPGPGFFPIWYGVAILVLSLLMVAGAVLKQTRTTTSPPQYSELRRVGLCWLAFVACIALMELLGFAVSFALLTWFIAAVLFKQRQRNAIAYAIGGAMVFYLVFVQALEVQLPTGILF